MVMLVSDQVSSFPLIERVCVGVGVGVDPCTMAVAYVEPQRTWTMTRKVIVAAAAAVVVVVVVVVAAKTVD